MSEMSTVQPAPSEGTAEDVAVEGPELAEAEPADAVAGESAGESAGEIAGEAGPGGAVLADVPPAAAAADSASGAMSSAADQPPESPDHSPLAGVALLEREGDLAADYLETLLDIADLDGDLDMDIEGDRATVDVVGKGLTPLIGSAGEALDALQELTRLAVQRETGVRSRLMLDIGGFRARRRAELHHVGVAAAEEVRRSGTPKELSPMTPFERKVIHDAVAGTDGVISESEGEGSGRFVVVRPA